MEDDKMSQIEILRLKLYSAIDEGDSEKILKASQELDNLILAFLKQQNAAKSVAGVAV